MELINYWIYGVVAFSVLFALRAPSEEDPRFLFRAVVLWPFSIALMLLELMWRATGWNFEAARDEKMFGFHMFAYPEVRGFAFTLFFAEVQFWKVPKA